MLRAACHTAGSGWLEVDNLARLSDLRKEKGNLLWAEADVRDLSDKDVATIAEEFSLHPLAVEDATHARQRPKLEPYEGHLFAVFHQLDEVDRQLEATQVACFIGDSYVLIIHAGADKTLDEAKRRWTASEVRSHPSFLMHTLVDVLVDNYQVLADRLEDEIEELEEIALDAPTAPIQRQLYSVKQRLARLRRYALPGSRVLDWIIDPRQHSLFSPDTAALFRDVHDHLMRINDQIKNVDDLTDAVMELRRTEQAMALNETTKRLTGWAAVIAVPTFIASFYGMNFELIPDEQSLAGFWFAFGLMAASGMFLYVFFKRRDWL